MIFWACCYCTVENGWDDYNDYTTVVLRAASGDSSDETGKGWLGTKSIQISDDHDNDAVEFEMRVVRASGLEISVATKTYC